MQIVAQFLTMTFVVLDSPHQKKKLSPFKKRKKKEKGKMFK